MVQNLAAAVGEQVTTMPQYRQFESKPYRPRMTPFWYFDRWPYLKFILRETSSVFVAYFAVITLIQIAAVNSGPTAYEGFKACMASPAIFIVNCIALAFLLFHAVTWFMLVPRVMARQVLGRSIPDSMAAMPNYGIWVAASILIALVALRII